MIPVRRRAALPAGHWWIAHRDHGHLTVTVSSLVPPGSHLEHELVREAVRAWRHQQRKGLILAPAPIAGGAGLGWLVRQFRRPTVAAGTAVAAGGIAFAAAVTLTEPPKPAHRPPVVAAPPSSPRVSAPPHVAPSHPSVPHAPGKTRSRRPAAATPVSVGLPRAPVPLPKVPPVRVRPPVLRPPVPTVSVPPVPLRPPVKAAQCRLVEIKVGKLARVCL
jgi:hypothetical protein